MYVRMVYSFFIQIFIQIIYINIHAYYVYIYHIVLVNEFLWLQTDHNALTQTCANHWQIGLCYMQTVGNNTSLIKLKKALYPKHDMWSVYFTVRLYFGIRRTECIKWNASLHN